MEIVLREFQPFVSNLRMSQCMTRILEEYFHHFGVVGLSRLVGKEFIFYQYDKVDYFSKFARRTREFLEELRTDHGIMAEQATYPSSEAAFDGVRQDLLKGIPVIVVVDTFYLPYSPQYQASHFFHYIILNGLSEIRNTFRIVDPSYKIRNQDFPIELIQTARCSTIGSYINAYETLRIPLPETIDEPDLDETLQFLKQNIQNMLYPDPKKIFVPTHPLMDNPDQDYTNLLIGLDGVYRLGTYFEELKAAPQLNKVLFQMYYSISDIAEATEHHMEYLKMTGERFAIAEFAVLADELEYIAQQWMLVKNMSMKAFYRDAMEMANRCILRLKALGDLEKEFLSHLGETLDKVATGLGGG